MKRWLSASFALGSFIGAVTVSAFAFFTLKFGMLNVPSAPVAAEPVSSTTTSATGTFAEAAAYFQQKGITLSSTPIAPLEWASWENVSPSDRNALQAAADIKQEWAKYSDDALKNSGLKAIYLVKGLTVNGQARSGMPEPDVTHALYFDISDVYLQSENGSYLRRTYHHEFAHYIEYQLTGSYAPEDAAWSSCNAKDTVYGNGGSSMYSDPEFAHKAHPSYGFIDGYATSGEEEDKAEMFAYYMTEPNYVQSLAAKDAGISCKLTQTKLLLNRL